MDSYKHGKGGPPFQLELKAQSSTNYCPGKALNTYIKMRGSAAGPLFVKKNGSRVKRAEFVAQLRANLGNSGLNTECYNSHSFRIGAALNAIYDGYNETQIIMIMAMGRWHSKAF